MLPNRTRLFGNRGNQIADLIPSLDGVRGFAVLLVLLDHASDEGLNIFPWANFDGAGEYGVYLFFALSAYLLTYPFFLRPVEELAKPMVWANYFLRRFLRIFPLFLVVLLVQQFRRDSFTWGDFVNHLLLRQGDGHFWTIPVEFKFYFILPLLVLLVGYLWRARGWIWGVVGGVAVYGFMEWVFYPAEAAWTVGGDEGVLLYESVNIFYCGALMGVLHAWLVKSGYRSQWLKITAEVLAVISMALVLLKIPAFHNMLFDPAEEVDSFDDMVDFCAIAWPVFLIAHVHGLGYVRWIFERAWLRYLGLISYSAYLWHRMVLGKTDDFDKLPPQVSLLIFITAICLVATVSFWLIERPLTRVRLRRRRPQPGTSAPMQA